MAERGLDVSGIENTPLALALWSLGGLLLAIGLGLFVWPFLPWEVRKRESEKALNRHKSKRDAVYYHDPVAGNVYKTAGFSSTITDSYSSPGKPFHVEKGRDRMGSISERAPDVEH